MVMPGFMWLFLVLSVLLYLLIETQRAAVIAVLNYVDARKGYGWQTVFEAGSMATLTSVVLYVSADVMAFLWASLAARLLALTFSCWVIRRRVVGHTQSQLELSEDDPLLNVTYFFTGRFNESSYL